MLALPDTPIKLCASAADVGETDEAAIVLIPSHLIESLDGQSFDVAINTGSFQEMTMSTARYYMDFLQNRARVDHLYSVNYVFEPKGLHGEGRQSDETQVNLTSPVLDDGWDTLHFEINPPNFTIDSPRNWLEVLLRRREAGTGSGALGSAETLAALSGVPEASPLWFEHLWTELWKTPDPMLVETYLAGLRTFVQGQGAVRPNYSEPLRKLPVDKLYERIGEVAYWRAVIAN